MKKLVAMARKMRRLKTFWPLKLDGLAVDDALQLACGDERAGGGERAEHDFKARARQRVTAGHIMRVHKKLADADQGRGQCAERVGERGPLGHGGHRNPDGHPRADDRADGKAGDDPDPRNDVRAHQRADDGGEHAAFGQEHAAPRSVGMRHSLQREDEEDGSDQVGGFHEVGGQGHLATSFPLASFRLALAEHLQHAVGDAKAADHVDSGGGDGDEAEDVRELG